MAGNFIIGTQFGRFAQNVYLQLLNMADSMCCLAYDTFGLPGLTLGEGVEIFSVAS